MLEKILEFISSTPFCSRGGNGGPGGQVGWEELICLESHTWFTARFPLRFPHYLLEWSISWEFLQFRECWAIAKEMLCSVSHSHSHVHTVGTWAHPPCKHTESCRLSPPPFPHSPFPAVLRLCQLVPHFYQNTGKKGMSRSSIIQFILQLVRLGVSTPGEETDSERLRKLP